MQRGKQSPWGWLFCGGWLFLSLSQAQPVSAEPRDASPASIPSATTAYDQLIDEAVQAYEAGRFAEARTSFRRAHELSPTARTLRTVGMCSFNLGDYVDAVLNLENALVDTRKPLTEEQQRHVADLITRANRRIGRFRMRLVPSETTLTADGQPAVVLAQSELLLEAGHHELEARAAGYQSAHSRVHVEGGDRSTLVFNLGRDSGAVADAASGANVSGVVGATPSVSGATLRLDSQSPPPTRSDSGSIVRTLGILSLSVGAAGLVAFGVTGALALGERGKLDDHCDDSRCPQEYSSDIDRYNTLRTTATITLISGGVLAALGVTLLLAGPSEHAESRQQAKLQPWIGLGSIGVRGQL